MQKEKREAALEKTRGLLVDLLLDVKVAAIRAGANPLKHIEQIQTRMMVAARTSASAEEWYTTLARKLQLGAPRSSTSSTLFELVTHVRETVGSIGFLDMVEREHGYLIALMRLAHEQAREARIAKSDTAIVDAAKEAANEDIVKEEIEETFDIELEDEKVETSS